MGSLIEVVTGQESLSLARVSINAGYIHYPDCPIQFTMKGTSLVAVAKSEHQGPNGNRIVQTQVKQPFFLSERNNHPAIQKHATPWMQRVYDIPNGVVIKLDFMEHQGTFGAHQKRGIIFIRARETGPLTEIRFRAGYGLDFIAKGRFDRLSPEAVAQMRLALNFNEMKYIDEGQINKFVSVDIVRPALRELGNHTETIEMDGQQVQITKQKSLRKVDAF